MAIMLLARGVAYLEIGRGIMRNDICVETISHVIIDGNLQPSNRLRQEDLAQRFGISATHIRSTSEHDRMLDALRSHDPDRAVAETQRHIRTVGDYLIASIVGAAKEALGD